MEVIKDGDIELELDRYENYFKPRDKIRDLEYWRDKVKLRLEGGGQPIGDRLPWDKTFDHFRIRPRELTLWTGYNGHWKSMILGQVFLWLVLQGRKCMIASFELSPDELIFRLICQAVGNQTPTDEIVEKFYAWTRNRFYIYEHEGIADRGQLAKVMNYGAAELKVSNFLVDSLMKCNIDGDDHNAQKRFLDELVTFSKQSNSHVHLVAHSRKRQDETIIPGKLDIAGSGDISNLAANVMVCHRNKRKEAEGLKDELDRDVKIMKQPDFRLICEKQNYGASLPRIGLWWNSEALQLTGGPDNRRNFQCLEEIKGGEA